MNFLLLDKCHLGVRSERLFSNDQSYWIVCINNEGEATEVILIKIISALVLGKKDSDWSENERTLIQNWPHKL